MSALIRQKGQKIVCLSMKESDNQWRSEANFRQEPTVKVLPFPPLKLEKN